MRLCQWKDICLLVNRGILYWGSSLTHKTPLSQIKRRSKKASCQQRSIHYTEKETNRGKFIPTVLKCVGQSSRVFDYRRDNDGRCGLWSYNIDKDQSHACGKVLVDSDGRGLTWSRQGHCRFERKVIHRLNCCGMLTIIQREVNGGSKRQWLGLSRVEEVVNGVKKNRDGL